MKFTVNNDTLAENKAIILYILNKINVPLSNNALLKLVVDIENMNYFYFQQFLLDLVENKYVITYLKNNESIYEITKEGVNALKLVEDLIPGIIKLNIDNTYKNTLAEVENEKAITSEYIPNDEKDYTVKCKITEKNRTLFETSILVGSIEQAKKISENWNQNSNAIYSKIIKLLNEESKPNKN